MDFSVSLQPGESIGDRIVRCCQQALADGPMGKGQRHDDYRTYISCEQEPTDAAAEALTSVSTSCAMFVRATRHWCGAAPAGRYVPGSPMFRSMGGVGFEHAAFVPHDGSNVPKPGDAFYIAPDKTSNKGHTGIFLVHNDDDTWDTAEGGGGADGTECRIRQRRIVGTKFADDQRTLFGWFDCTQVGLPESPAE